VAKSTGRFYPTGFQQEWGTFTVLPMKMRCLYYWWEPDTTFLSLKGKQITYSPHDAAAWGRGDASSTAKGVSIDTWTWWLLWVGSQEAKVFLKHLFRDV